MNVCSLILSLYLAKNYFTNLMKIISFIHENAKWVIKGIKYFSCFPVICFSAVNKMWKKHAEPFGCFHRSKFSFSIKKFFSPSC